MDRLKTILLAGLVVLCSSAMAQKFSLQQCIETGIAQNFDVNQRVINEQTEKLNYKQAKLNLLPDLNGQVSHSFNQGRSIDPFNNTPVTQSFNSSNYSLSSGVVVFNGFARANAVRAANLSWQASQQELQQEKDNLTINIILAYLQVLSISDQLVLVKEQAQLSTKQVERLNELNTEGSIKPSELSDLRGQQANDQLAIVNTQNNLEQARLSLCRLMNITYTKDMELERLVPEDFIAQYDNDADKIYRAALSQLAIIKAADLRRQSAEKNLRMTKGGLWPTLSFNANAYTQYSSIALLRNYINTTDVQSTDYVMQAGSQSPVFKKQDNFSTSRIAYNDQLKNNISNSAVFSLSIPLFNSLQQQNRIKQARLDIQRNELLLANTKQQVQQDVQLASVNIETAMQRYKTLLEQLKAYEESFKAADARFTEGVSNSVDYLIAKNNIDRVNINLVNARYDYVLRSKILDFYQGKKLW